MGTVKIKLNEDAWQDVINVLWNAATEEPDGEAAQGLEAIADSIHDQLERHERGAWA